MELHQIRNQGIQRNQEILIISRISPSPKPPWVSPLALGRHSRSSGTPGVRGWWIDLSLDKVCFLCIPWKSTEFHHFFFIGGITSFNMVHLSSKMIDFQAIPVVPPGEPKLLLIRCKKELTTTLFWQTNMINDTPSASKEVRASRTQEIVGAFSKTRFLHVFCQFSGKTWFLTKKKRPVSSQQNPYLSSHI